MFTGIVEGTGVVATNQPRAGGVRELIVNSGSWRHEPAEGESVAVNGCCLTVTRATTVSDRPLRFQIVGETEARTTLAGLAPGTRVNLERAASASTLLGGHIVQGHIDGVAEVVRVEMQGGVGGDRSAVVRLRPPRELMPFVVPKGSVALDGVSLTIATVEAGEGSFEVALIPTTLAKTTLGSWRPGTQVNMECDVLAKTVVHFLRHFKG